MNRADAKQPWKYMDPSKDQRVCSEHFIDGEPTGQHPDPELHLGYELPGSKIKTENIQRIPIDQVMGTGASVTGNTMRTCKTMPHTFENGSNVVTFITVYIQFGSTTMCIVIVEVNKINSSS